MTPLINRLRSLSGHMAEEGILGAATVASAATALEAKDAEIARLRGAVDVFMRCAYPVAPEINERGHNWSEAYLDDALIIARAALGEG